VRFDAVPTGTFLTPFNFLTLSTADAQRFVAIGVATDGHVFVRSPGALKDIGTIALNGRYRIGASVTPATVQALLVDEGVDPSVANATSIASTQPLAVTKVELGSSSSLVVTFDDVTLREDAWSP
jgi:hypothetical protein